MSDATPPPTADLPSWDRDGDLDEGPGRSGLTKVLIAGVGVIAGLLLVVGVIAVLSGDSEDLDWPQTASGPPAGLGVDGGDVTAAAGVYIWSDFDGWHLRVVNGDGIAGARGTIGSDKDFPPPGEENSAVLSTDGVGTVSVTGKQVVFDLPADAQVAGVDFNTEFFAKELTFTIESGDGPIDVSSVTLGSDTTPDEMPFTVKKVEKTD